MYVRGKLEKKDARDIFREYVDNLSVEKTVCHHGWFYNICLLRPSKCVLGYKRLQSCLCHHVSYLTNLVTMYVKRSQCSLYFCVYL